MRVHEMGVPILVCVHFYMIYKRNEDRNKSLVVNRGTEGRIGLLKKF